MTEENNQQQSASQEPKTQPMAWYVIHTQTGYEDKVAKQLLQKAFTQGFQDRIFNVWVPVEYVKTRNQAPSQSIPFPSNQKPARVAGANRYWREKAISPAEWNQREKDKNKNQSDFSYPGQEQKNFPSYVFVQMNLTSETYWFIKNITGVTGFLGDPSPIPVPEEEIANIWERTCSSKGQPKYMVEFKRGDSVLIIEGPFKHFIGTVEEVHEQKHKLNVIVTVFDRATPVEVDFLQVEKN